MLSILARNLHFLFGVFLHFIIGDDSSYGDWLGDNKEPNWKDVIKQKIDEILPSCTSFEDFIAALRAAEFIVSEKRKKISVRAPGQKRPWRLDTLEGDYTEAAIRERIAGVRIIKVSSDSGTHTYQPGSGRVSLLVDIQAKIREGRGSGYEQWAKIFNLNERRGTNCLSVVVIRCSSTLVFAGFISFGVLSDVIRHRQIWRKFVSWFAPDLRQAHTPP